MDSVMNLTYESSLSRLCEINESFDSGVLRIAYHGANRNGSYISKQAFERSIETIWNCPVVCNYDRDNDVIGAHDVEVITDKDGKLRLVNTGRQLKKTMGPRTNTCAWMFYCGRGKRHTRRSSKMGSRCRAWKLP